MKKVLLPIVLVIAMMCNMLPAIAAQSDGGWGATATLDAAAVTRNMAVQLSVAGTKPKTAERDGVCTWVVNGWEANYYGIFADILTGSVRSVGNENVLVEVDYYDESADAWFYIKYNSRDEKECYTNKQYTTGSKKWKTAAFVLEAPYFTDTVPGADGAARAADFEVSALMSNEYSRESVLIREIRVKQLEEIKPASINLVTNRTGNIYFSDDEYTFTLEAENKLDIDFTADLRIYLKDIHGKTVHEQTDTISLTALEKQSKEIKLDFDEFGVFFLHIEGTNAEQNFRFSTYNGISFARRSEFLNDRFGVNNKFGYATQMGRDTDSIFELLQKSGIGWSRDEVFWYEFEEQPGRYALNDRHKQYMKSAQDYGIKQLIIFGYGHPVHTGHANTFPVSQESIDAFGQYAYELAKQTKEYGVSHFEILNEYNHYNAKRDISVYDDIAKAVAEGARRANPDATMVGFTASGTGQAFIQEVFDAGGAEYIDVISWHDYVSGSPLANGVDDDTKSITEFLKANYPEQQNLPIWKTEMGWSSGKNGATWVASNDDEKTASYLPQEFILQMSAGLDKMFQYQFMDWDLVDKTQISYLEMAWGMVDTYKGIKNPYGAKPAFIATAAMNSILGTPEYKSKQQEDGINIFHFTRAQDGKDTAAIWTEEGNRYITLNIPNADIKLYDIYGNPLDAVKDGDNYSFNLSDQQVYIEGDYETIEIGNPVVYISDKEITTVPGEEISFSLYRVTDEKLNIEIVKNEESDIEIVSIPSFDRKIAIVKIKANGMQGYNEDLQVKVKNEAGDEVFESTLTIKYDEPISVSGRTQLYDGEDIKRWKLAFNIKSNYHSGNLKATLKIHEPKEFARFDVDLGTIKPGENNVSFHLPEIPQFTAYNFSATLELSNGYKKDIAMPIDFALAFNADTPPTIDGNITPEEYPPEGKMVTDRLDRFYYLMPQNPWLGKEDQSAETYMQWDENYLYLASIVEDDVHYCAFEGAGIWQGDCMQLGINYGRENGGSQNSFTELGFALNHKGVVEKQKYSAESGTSISFSEDTEVIIKREGTKTYYEMRLAWRDILPEGASLGEGQEFTFAFMVNENDGYGRRGWIEYGSGLGDGKNVAKFARVKLVN